MSETPMLIKSKMKHYGQRIKYPNYFSALKKMVQSESWQKMLKYNPIRSEHEMKWYLESRFRGHKTELINVGLKSRIIAFDTGPIYSSEIEKLSYP